MGGESGRRCSSSASIVGRLRREWERRWVGRFGRCGSFGTAVTLPLPRSSRLLAELALAWRADVVEHTSSNTLCRTVARLMNQSGQFGSGIGRIRSGLLLRVLLTA